MGKEVDLNRVTILEIGEWKADQVKIHVVTQKQNIKLYTKDKQAIEKKWVTVKEEKPSTTPDPTVRLIGWHSIDDNLILEVIPSDYKEAQVLGKLGIAMVPITKEDYIVLQGPSEDRDHMYGEHLRPPGCTPTGPGIFKKVIEEMNDEFGVRVEKDDFIVVGLIHVQPPAGPMPEFCLVIRVDYKENFKRLRDSWEEAKDKKEGKPVWLALNVDKGTTVLDKSYEGQRYICYAGCAPLLMVINSRLTNMNFAKYKWFDRIDILGGLRPKNRSIPQKN